MGNAQRRGGGLNKKVLVVGLSGAGSTTVFNQLLGKKNEWTSPTIATTASTLDVNKFAIELWDVGYVIKMKPCAF
jgi:septin family protein